MPSDCGLWIGELSSGEVTQITSNTDPPCDREYMPHWSPDGSAAHLLAGPVRERPANRDGVFVINADGTNERRLTDPAMFAGFPDWSPDGEWIVFDTYPLLEFQCCQVSNLYRMHPDGSGMEQLTHYATEELRATQPRYTPDGAVDRLHGRHAGDPQPVGHPGRGRGADRPRPGRHLHARHLAADPRHDCERPAPITSRRIGNYAGHAERQVGSWRTR